MGWFTPLSPYSPPSPRGESVPKFREIGMEGGHVLGVGGDDTDLGVRLDGSVADVMGADDSGSEIEYPKLGVDDSHGVAHADIDAVPF